MRMRRTGGRRERGSTLVEFGLLALPLLLLLLGGTEGARFVYTYNQVNDASRQGARYAIAHFANISEGTSNDSNVQNAARSSLDAIVASGITCSTLKQSNGTGPNGDPTRYVEVTCSYTFTPVARMLPFTKDFSIKSRMYIP